MSENATVGTVVLRVRAIDTDIGSNGQVRYRIRKTSSHHRGGVGRAASEGSDFFSVDPYTGAITLTRSLDRETQKIHTLRIEAYDLGIPTPLQSDLDLTVYVKNVNDHEPQFTVDEFQANFTEHRTPGAERVLLVKAVDRDVEDGDEDYAALLDICYFIVGGNGDGYFDLKPRDHELVASRELDREKQDAYELVVLATEECLDIPEAKEVEFDPKDDRLLRVVVFVNDIDDNSPQFVKPVFTGGIATDVDFGTPFMTVHAVDADYGKNARLEYSLDGEIVASLGSEGVEDIKKPPFLVHPDTGDIVLNFDPQKGMKGYFDFGVSASDRSGHVDKAKVQIYLLREDQRVKFVMRSHPSEMRESIDGFLDVLSDVTGAVVNADAFKTHENRDGTMDKTKTDVLLHFVDPRDNRVMEAGDVLRLIDYRTEELAEAFKQYDVLYTEGVEPSYVRNASIEDVLVYSLAGVSLFLILILIFVVCICLKMRQKYELYYSYEIVCASTLRLFTDI